MLTEEIVLACAEQIGFAKAAVTNDTIPVRFADYEQWLKKGYHGSMSFMSSDINFEARKSSNKILEGTQSIIVCALNYDKPSDATTDSSGKISCYVTQRDYHHVMKSKLSLLAQQLASVVDCDFEFRALVDSAPVLERDLAERAGLSFTGKNTMAIIPGVGSYFFIGSLFTTLPLTKREIGNPVFKGCGDCTACLDACPTKAFPEPYKLDATQCISYLTIEHDGDIPTSLQEKMGVHIYGCDICQQVCPYNATSKAPPPTFTPYKNYAPNLHEVLEMRSSAYKRFVKGTAMSRASAKKLRRNATIALRNIERKK